VQSERTQRLGRSTVLSLDVLQDSPRPLRREFALIDRDAEDPAEVVRRRMDFSTVLATVSDGAQAVLTFLAASHGQGRQADLAGELGISPGRVSQLKHELGDALAAHGYAGPLGARPTPRASAAA
ncbi:MAG: hypothetical protein ACODAQ_12500, partial [Phycisphaeraceae bacterium]